MRVHVDAAAMLPDAKDAAFAVGVPSDWLPNTSSEGDWMAGDGREAAVVVAVVVGLAGVVWLLRRRRRRGMGGDGGDEGHVSAEWVNVMLQGYAPDIFNGRYEEVRH